MVHRVLKARYFPEIDFLRVELGSCPSFAWRSIMAAHKIVRQGCRWQVGDGASIGIWFDKWLFEPSTSRVLFRPNTIPPNSRVNSLIDIHTRE